MAPDLEGTRKSGLSANHVFCFFLFFTAFFRTYRLTSYFTYQDILILFGFIFVCFLNLDFMRSKVGVFLILILLISTLAIATSSNSVDLFHNYINILKVVQCYVLFPFLCLRILQTQSSIKFAILGFLSGAFVSGIIAVKPDQILFSGPELRVSGTLGHPVFSGVMFAFAIILALSSFLTEIQGWKFIRLALVVFFSIVVIRTQSGTALLVLGMGFLCWVILVILSDSKISTKILFVTSSTLALILLNNYLQGLLIFQRVVFNLTSNRTSSFIPTSAESTLAIRWQTIGYAWDKIRMAPILGNGLDLPGQFNLSGMQPHSIFLLAWQTGGVLLLLGSIFLLIDGIDRMAKSITNRMIVPLTLFIGTWLTMFTNPFFYDVSFISAYYLGIFIFRFRIQMQNSA